MRIFTFPTLILLVLAGLVSGHFSAQAQCTIVVQAQVNISMPPSCSYAVPPSVLLTSGTNCPGGNFVVEIFQGGVWAPANLNATHIGQNLTARVRDLVSGNSAFCTLVVEDKLPPVLTNCGNLTISCEDACQPILAPTVQDCSPVISNLFSTTENLPCTSSFTRRITQTYTVRDIYNNTSNCTRTISYSRRAPNTVVFPSNISLLVSGTNCSPWCNNGSGRPSPTTANTGSGHFGSPMIDGSPIFPNVRVPGTCAAPCVSDACQMTVTYGDVQVPICGTNRRIDRTWQVSSACGSPAVQNYLQRIWIYTDGNTTCGAACGVPFNLNQSYSGGLTTFVWSIPATTCMARYDLEYRLRIGGVWQPWVSVVLTTNSYSASLPSGVPAEWRVRTRCNGGVNSAYSAVKSFVTNLTDSEVTEYWDNGESELIETPVSDAPAMAVFPNPARGPLTLQFNEAVSEDSELWIANLQGHIVYQTMLMEGMISMDLETEGLPAGMYLATLRQPNGNVFVAKWVLID